jgi:hypothetical protein
VLRRVQARPSAAQSLSVASPCREFPLPPYGVRQGRSAPELARGEGVEPPLLIRRKRVQPRSRNKGGPRLGTLQVGVFH